MNISGKFCYKRDERGGISKKFPLFIYISPYKALRHKKIKHLIFLSQRPKFLAKPAGKSRRELATLHGTRKGGVGGGS
jgi:hypothetical protein